MSSPRLRDVSLYSLTMARFASQLKSRANIYKAFPCFTDMMPESLINSIATILSCFTTLHIEPWPKIWTYALHVPGIVELCFYTMDLPRWLPVHPAQLHHSPSPRNKHRVLNFIIELYSSLLFAPFNSLCKTQTKPSVNTIYFGSANRPLHVELPFEIFGQGVLIDYEETKHVTSVFWWSSWGYFELVVLSSGAGHESLIWEGQDDSDQEAGFIDVDETGTVWFWDW
jgi:hypothetical protein